VPPALAGAPTRTLADAYEQVNAPFGAFDQATLKASTKALASGSATDDGEYTRTEAAIQALAAKRDRLASTMKQQLDGAAFSGRRIPPAQALAETAAAKLLVAGAEALAKTTP